MDTRKHDVTLICDDDGNGIGGKEALLIYKCFVISQIYMDGN